jgi:hypothetical protein
MNTFRKHKTANILIVLLATAAMLVGCADMKNWFGGTSTPPPATTQPAPRAYAQIDVPQPVNLLLPKSINIHPFTVTRKFDQGGGIRGVDVRIEAFNSFLEATKAFGSFRFEVYAYQQNSQEPKGALRGVWEIEPSLLDPRENLRYWNRSQQMYEFKLQWDKPIPVGQKFVLVSVFTSPFTKRLRAERIFTSGE